jgi:dipeptidase E
LGEDREQVGKKKKKSHRMTRMDTNEEILFADICVYSMMEIGLVFLKDEFCGIINAHGEKIMRNIILTANGFENKNIGKTFLRIVDKNPSEIKVIFVPTAANNADAIEVLPKCMHDLLDLGIPAENVLVYDLHYNMEYDELSKYDAIYFCGGSSSYLLQRINETGFNESLKTFVDNGGVYIGVSAGSIIAANNLPANLEYLHCQLSVHVKEGISVGQFEPTKHSHIKLPDNKAIIIKDSTYEVII